MAGRNTSRGDASASAPAPKVKVRKTLEQRRWEAEAKLERIRAEEAAEAAKNTGNKKLAAAVVAFEKVAPFLPAELAKGCREALNKQVSPTAVPMHADDSADS